MTRHLPDRPHWHCVTCDTPWPCPTRRTELAAEWRTDRYSTAGVMAGHLLTALDDLPNVPARDLYQRFLGWPR